MWKKWWCLMEDILKKVGLAQREEKEGLSAGSRN